MTEFRPSKEIMDLVAADLGAPSADAFIRIASSSMLCAFKLACRYRQRIAVLEAKLSERGAQHV